MKTKQQLEQDYIERKKFEVEYNSLVSRIYKGMDFIDSNLKHPGIENYYKQYKDLVDKTSEYIGRAEKVLGRKMTVKEVVDGF